MFFDRELALAALPELGPRTRALLERLLPGAVTLLLPSDRFPLAGGAGTLGLRVPDLPALAGLARPVLQTSANLAGGPDPRRLDDVPEPIRRGADARPRRPASWPARRRRSSTCATTRGRGAWSDRAPRGGA